MFGIRRCTRIWPSPGYTLHPRSFSWVWRVYSFPDFFAARLPNPSIAGYGTDRRYPVRGHAVLGVVTK
ncbi:hypothetical protein Acr_00g0088610 [Actinidia rufa]|uniref:Uncharacterized protein n=1 Tax=Actinidia rufa TaxID=165716 RepID=A0A7J0DXM3_9ERIC|nr:hypothetical protein Acr_00g0088610 [Actinidia rufa]